MSTKYISCVILIVFLTTAASGGIDKYSKIRIYVPDRAVLGRIWDAGIDFEGSSGKIGGWMEFVAGAGELRDLKSQGIPYSIVVDDLRAVYEKALSSGPRGILGFGYGSMGGYLTYDEVVLQLDSMKLLYPQLITTKTYIGITYEGRAIWAVKISANAEVEDPAKPEVLYTALHHAREAEGMMSLMYYMWWLLENNGSDPEATYLINHRQMWFVPVVNVDGYVYNQATSPGGGGMWRKNRSYSSPGVYGVDLNRNYGTYEMWNSPNGGSSTSPGAETYRGTAPFSEAETASIDAFVRMHNFRDCLNYHTYGNYLVFPWGYLSRESRDSLIYRDWAYDMTFANHFTGGTDQQTVNYSTRGSADDYLFGDTSKPATYSMTPEVGTTGFWPTIPEIYPLAQANLPMNKLLAYFAGSYPTIRHYEVLDPDSDGFIEPGESFTLALSVRNRGLGSARSMTFTANGNIGGIQFSPSSITVDSIPPQQTVQVLVSGKAAGNLPSGVPFRVYVTLADTQGFLSHDTLNCYIGEPTVLFSDSASGGTSKWMTGAGWGLTSQAHTPPSSFTDSPSGAYLPYSDNSLTTVNTIDLSGYDYAELKFWAKWAIEPTWDFATVELSTDSGTTWTTLRSELSHSGSGRGSRQPSSAWGYESYTPGLIWLEQQIDLTSWLNKQIKIRFRVAADGADQRDGFSVDDIRIYAYKVENPLSFSVTDGWNLVSVPAVVGNRKKSVLFPSATSPAFAYEGNYVPRDTLDYGRGYWLKFSGDQSIPIGGLPVYTDTITYGWGWFMTGNPLSCTAVITSSDTAKHAFIYAGGYIMTDTIPLGSGFWVKGGTTITLACAETTLLASSWRNGSGDFSSLNSLTVSDRSGNAATLYFGTGGRGQKPFPDPELPPTPPFGLFDARFTSQLMTEFFSAGMGETGQRTVAVQSTSRPITVAWDMRETGVWSYSLIDLGGRILASDLRGQASVTVDDPRLSSIILRRQAASAPPRSYALHQNYPNPFNPTTIIDFDLPVQSLVSLKVYNILGQLVREVLQERPYPEGRFSVNFDSRDLTSGIYFYTLNAKSRNGKIGVSLVNKMMIVK